MAITEIIREIQKLSQEERLIVLQQLVDVIVKEKQPAKIRTGGLGKY